MHVTLTDLPGSRAIGIDSSWPQTFESLALPAEDEPAGNAWHADCSCRPTTCGLTDANSQTENLNDEPS